MAMPSAPLSSITIIIGLLMFSSSLAGQSKAASAPEPKVNVPFFANDKHGKPVSGIAPSDVAALDNRKAPQRVLGIRGRIEVPLLLGILIDISGSQRTSKTYKDAVQAASEFSNQVLSGADDRVFIERFAVAPEATQLMTKSQLSALKIDLNPGGLTALYDALRFACDTRMEGDPRQDYLRVIVLLSDGEDNHSRNSLREAITSAQRAGAVIFSVDTGTDRPQLPPLAIPGPHRIPGDETLKELAEATGGIAFLHLDDSLFKAFATIKGQIDNMYLLSYVAEDSNRKARFHSLELRHASRTDLKLRSPKGYYGGAATK
jgi:Ca-activated chloride channel family protein